VSTRRDLFANFSDEAAFVDADDPWQFTNFLIRS
jgi:homospermidine synthase